MFTDIFSSFPAGGAGAALLILRVFVGVAFLFHGYGKIVDVPAFASEFGMPWAAAAAAAYTQFVSGLLLIVGLLTPLAGSAIAATMAVATFVLIRRGETFIDPHGHTWEAPAFYLVASIAVSLLGPGLISFDALLFG